jgi:phosphoserine phosphatase
MLLQTCADLGIEPQQAIAMGDGANDLPMMGVAGLSVAYHAKPAVREQAMVSINRAAWTACWKSWADRSTAPCDCRAATR